MDSSRRPALISVGTHKITAQILQTSLIGGKPDISDKRDLSY
jgi:hypothetical protein